MRIAAVQSSQGKQFGEVVGQNFHPFLDGHGPVGSLRAVIEADAASFKRGPPVALADVRLLAPVGPLATNVICVGKNYSDHAAEFARSGFDASGDKQEAPAEPVVFTKATNTLADPLQAIDSSLDPTHSVDYEGELGVIIGRRCKKAKATEALDYVYGYTIVNDVTARELQQRHRQWFLGKSLAGFCPVGPWVVTRDEIPDLYAQHLKTFVNGELRQSASLKTMIFNVERIIETVSAYVTLEPGDLLATGTPAGVGIGFKPPRYLKAGDQVRIEISGIGELSNPVV
jgi:2-keto-4-pentenoate hydratase/2-oxohepta-3-ene-1,7-dioic acid hydratase in catechol pathway